VCAGLADEAAREEMIADQLAIISPGAWVEIGEREIEMIFDVVLCPVLRGELTQNNWKPRQLSCNMQAVVSHGELKFMLNVACRCGDTLELPESLLGEPVDCPSCGKILRVRHIEDNKSTNGSFVNGRRVTTRLPLGHGDVITVGEFELEFHDPTLRSDISNAQNSGGIDLDAIGEAYDIIEEPAVARLPSPAALAQQPAAVKLGTDAISCPSCATKYPKTTKICVGCGININTGRAILMSSDLDENALYANTETIIRAISWIMGIGFFPIASDSYGSKKPYAIWGIAAATVLITIGVWITNLSSGPQSTKDLMLWTGREPTARDIERGAAINQYTHDGDSAAFDKKLPDKPEDELTDEEVVKAYNQLEPEQQFYGQFHWYQLITNGFLHAGIMHLAGNMVFLLVFGSRVNALIGTWKTLALYPILLVLASLTFMASQADHSPMAALGASGAIMGLAGMYLVLFPINRVFMVAWIRLGLLTGFRIGIKIFAVRGFWVVLFYIAFDVFATVFGTKDGTAHWAHLGGFGAGVVLALILLVARQIDANRTDLFSLALGKNAWQILGKPGSARIAAA
jgi:membrane associated rhomboid family serine protease